MVEDDWSINIQISDIVQEDGLAGDLTVLVRQRIEELVYSSKPKVTFAWHEVPSFLRASMKNEGRTRTPKGMFLVIDTDALTLSYSTQIGVIAFELNRAIQERLGADNTAYMIKIFFDRVIREQYGFFYGGAPGVGTVWPKGGVASIQANMQDLR